MEDLKQILRVFENLKPEEVEKEHVLQDVKKQLMDEVLQKINGDELETKVVEKLEELIKKLLDKTKEYMKQKVDIEKTKNS